MYCNFPGDELLRRVLPPLLLVEFVLGVIGNGLAIWFLCFHLKTWKSSTVCLFNLALADFLLIVALPFRARYYHSGMIWEFGDTFCKITLFMLAMNRSGSILFLMTVAIDRYMHVVHPHHPVNFLRVSRAACGAAGLWLVTISMTAHLLAIPQRNITRCESFGIDTESNPGLAWHRSMFVFSFYLPLGVILFCTVRVVSRLRGRHLTHHAKVKRAVRFIMAVVFMFIVCFLPSNIVQLLMWFTAWRTPTESVCDSLKDLNRAFYITISLTYLNSMLDPVIYYFSSPRASGAFKRFFWRDDWDKRRALAAPGTREEGEPETQAPRSSANCDSQVCSQY